MLLIQKGSLPKPMARSGRSLPKTDRVGQVKDRLIFVNGMFVGAAAGNCPLGAESRYLQCVKSDLTEFCKRPPAPSPAAFSVADL